MKTILSVTILLSAMISPAFGQQTPSGRPPYPKTEKVDQSDDYFGTKVNDPYRWLENDTAVSVGKWVEAQNLVTNALTGRLLRDGLPKS